MKAYDIKIELLGSEPLIWRRIRMPAGATFNRLHTIIQRSLNFQSRWADQAYHLYMFDLSDENLLVTNDEEAYIDHKNYQKNRKRVEKRLAAANPEWAGRERQRLQKVVRKPERLKVDKYLEEYKTLEYVYDFGDNWEILVTLENTVEDYHFGYPTLLDGANDAPPEDVGGIPGFAYFLEVYNDPKDPEHDDIVEWAHGQGFRHYDPETINEDLKSVHYQKTEWDKLDHDNYELR